MYVSPLAKNTWISLLSLLPSSPKDSRDSPKFTPAIVKTVPPRYDASAGPTSVIIGAASGANRLTPCSKFGVRVGAPSTETRQFRGLSQINSVRPSSVREKRVNRYSSMCFRRAREHLRESSVDSLITQLKVLPPALEYSFKISLLF